MCYQGWREVDQAARDEEDDKIEEATHRRFLQGQAALDAGGTREVEFPNYRKITYIDNRSVEEKLAFEKRQQLRSGQ